MSKNRQADEEGREYVNVDQMLASFAKCSESTVMLNDAELLRVLSSLLALRGLSKEDLLR